MAGADRAEVPDGSEPLSAAEGAGTEESGAEESGAEEETEPTLDEMPQEGGEGEEEGPEEAPETRKAPPPAAYGGLRVHAVGAAPSKSSGEVRPSPGPSPSAWS